MQKDFNTLLIEQFIKFEELFSKFLSSPEPSVFKCVDLLLSEIIKLEFINKIYVFLTNEETFLFEYLTQFPPSDSSDVPDLFDIVGNTEIINIALQTLDAQVCKNNESDTYNFLVPLVSFNKLIGFVLTQSSLPPEKLTLLFIKILRAFFNQLATAIDLLNTNEHLKQAKDNYQQLLATQSLETQRTNLEFSQRLNEITTNLSMILPHEIRTPINQILGSTKLLKEYVTIIPEEDAQGMKEIISDIDASVNRLRNLSENYIFYSNLVIIANDISKLQQLTKERVLSPQSVIFERCSLAMHHNNRGDNLVINLIDAPIKMNEIFLDKIVEEIMDNAIKFSYPNSKIKINTYIDGNFYVLSVLNYGKGLTKEEINAIQPFLQFERSQNEQQGSGLGLSIVYKIMSIFGGNVKIQSDKDSYFEISLYFRIAYN